MFTNPPFRSLVLAMAAVLPAIGPVRLQGAVYFASAQSSGPTDPQTLQVSQFNPAWGTLNAITVKFQGSFDGTIGAENLFPLAGNVQMSYSGVTLVTGPGLAFSPGVFVSSSPDLQFLSAAYDGTTDYAGPSGMTVAINQITLQQVSVLPANTSGYTGGGSVSFTAYLQGSTTGTGPGQISLNSTVVPTVFLEVEYEYEPVPEPSTLAAAGLGIGVLLRRRRMACQLGLGFPGAANPEKQIPAK